MFGWAVGLFLIYLIVSQADTAAGPDIPDPGDTGVDETKVQQFARAIATAEGYGLAGAIPTTHNNPGDLERLGEKIQYPDAQTGWAALYAQVRRIFTGHSLYYGPTMTIQQIANKYVAGGQQTPDAEAWAANVATLLGLTPDNTVQDFLDS